MSVRTCVTMNEKIEYKVVDEQGRSVSPMPLKANGGATSQNELILLKKNSILLE